MSPDVSELADRMRAAKYGIGASDIDEIRLQTLEVLGRSFEEAPDAMTPWAALAYAIDRDIALPNWLLVWLRTCAARINEVRLGAAKDGSVHREADAIGNALGFGKRGGGRTSIITKTNLSNRDLDIAMHVLLEQAAGSGFKAAISIVAESFDVSTQTARRAFTAKKEHARAYMRLTMKNLGISGHKLNAI